jgi:hypothetical protein
MLVHQLERVDACDIRITLRNMSSDSQSGGNLPQQQDDMHLRWPLRGQIAAASVAESTLIQIVRTVCDEFMQAARLH